MTMEFQTLPPEPEAAGQKRNAAFDAHARKRQDDRPVDVAGRSAATRFAMARHVRPRRQARPDDSPTGNGHGLPLVAAGEVAVRSRKAQGGRRAAEDPGRSAGLRAARHHRRGRHGRGLRGPPIVDRPHRRREDAQAVGQGPRGAARQVHLRSGRHRRARPSEHRADLRPGLERRRARCSIR